MHLTEAPNEFIGQISVLFAFLAGWQKRTDIYISSVEILEQTHYGFITSDLAASADFHLSQSELAGNSEQVFQFLKLFFNV